jgi:ubiquinone biosynthesis protein UbiJ
MEEYDSTTPPQTESERQSAALAAIWEALDGLNERLETLEHRIANLEVQRTPADNNLDDPEWY